MSNRPIVLLQPGHEVRGIPAVWSCKKHCFLYFSLTPSYPNIALRDCLFSQLAWKTQLMFGDVLVRSNVDTGKSPDLSDFHPYRSRQSLAIAPVSRLNLTSARGDIQEEQSISRCSLDNKVLEWSDERLSSSASPPGVVFELVDGWATCTATERLPEL